MAETINLTPDVAQTSNLSFIARIADTEQAITINGATTNIDSTSVAALVDGSASYIDIEFFGTGGVNGTFKKPPTAFNVKLNDAIIIGEDVPIANINNSVIVANYGRIYFKPSFLGAIKRAIAAVNGDIEDIREIDLDIQITPVYKNPSTQNPSYEPGYAALALDCSEVSWTELVPTDWMESEPYIFYNANTKATPAGIGAIHGVE